MKNLTIENHSEFYNLIGKKLGLEFNYSKDYTAYIVIKEDEMILDTIEAIETVSKGLLSGVIFNHKNRTFNSGAMSGSFENGTTSQWIKVIKK